MSGAREPNFDRIAAIYQWAEYLSLGPLLQRARNYFLPQLGDVRRALLLGDGDGRFLEQLLLRNPNCEAVAVDTSAAMLEHLRRRCQRSVPDAAARLRTVQQSALTMDAAPMTDLVVTHFVLDCFSQSEVDALTAHLAAQLAPGALWLVSDFAMPRSCVLRPFAAIYIRLLYAVFRVLTGLKVARLPDAEAALRCAGLTRVYRHSLLGGLIYTELWRRE
jgi:ubiquinone/menaquinone biosynthesis C-methylase UbiE